MPEGKSMSHSRPRGRVRQTEGPNRDENTDVRKKSTGYGVFDISQNLIRCQEISIRSKMEYVIFSGAYICSFGPNFEILVLGYVGFDFENSYLDEEIL